MDVSQLSYPDGRFELVCAFQTHFHWPDLQQALSEIKRVLADDGRFIIACEQSKVTYYLPDLKDNKEFADYLDKMGLRLLDCQKTGSLALLCDCKTVGVNINIFCQKMKICSLFLTF